MRKEHENIRIILCYVMLCAMLCLLRYVMLRHNMLCYVVCCVMLRYVRYVMFIMLSYVTLRYNHVMLRDTKITILKMDDLEQQ